MALFEAVANGNLSKVKQLIDEGANVNQKDEDERTALHWAAAAGQLDIVELLVNVHAISINSQDDAGWTPLMSATSAGHLDVVGLLLSRGANANLANENGQLPLHYHRGRQEMVELLVDYTKDIDRRDHTGTTPLMRALGGRPSRDVLLLLLDHGAKVNARDQLGNTPLHLALMEEHEDLAMLLVEAGSDPMAKNQDKVRCIDMAKPALRAQMQTCTERKP